MIYIVLFKSTFTPVKKKKKKKKKKESSAVKKDNNFSLQLHNVEIAWKFLGPCPPQ
jgi:hypothetical protein